MAYKIPPSTGTGLGYVLVMRNVIHTTQPSDGVTYFMNESGINTVFASGTVPTRMYVPKAGTVTQVFGAVTVIGTLGSAENSTLSLRLNNTTDTLITSTLQFSATSNAFSITGLSIAVTEGDYLEFKLVAGTWVTNPTQCAFNGSVYIA